MSVKFFLYIIVSVIVFWGFGSININKIFKKNKVAQATIFYFLLGISMIYLVTNFLYDFFTSTLIL